MAPCTKKKFSFVCVVLKGTGEHVVSNSVLCSPSGDCRILTGEERDPVVSISLMKRNNSSKDNKDLPTYSADGMSARATKANKTKHRVQETIQPGTCIFPASESEAAWRFGCAEMDFPQIRLSPWPSWYLKCLLQYPLKKRNSVWWTNLKIT